LTFDSFSRYNGSRVIKKIKQPILIIHGEKDTIIPLFAAKKLNAINKHSLLTVLPDANHVLILNNPDEIKKSIHAFLKKMIK
jgi:pimeloyl-ACP methyl ester carboxylesterase